MAAIRGLVAVWFASFNTACFHNVSWGITHASTQSKVNCADHQKPDKNDHSEEYQHIFRF